MAKKDIRREAKETAVIIEDALRSISSRIGDIFQEALDETGTVSEAMAKEVQSSMNSLAKVSKDLADSYQKAYDGAYKQADLQKTINARKAKQFAIEAKIEAIANRSNLSAEEKAKLTKDLNKELDIAVSYNEDLENSLQKQVNISKNINKAMGLTGGALKGLSKLAGGLGLDNLEDVFTDAKSASMEMAKQVSKDGEVAVGIGGKMRTAFAGVGVALKGIGAALMDPLFIIGLIFKAVKGLVGIFTHVASLTNQVGQAFGVAGANAAKLKEELHAAGDLSADAYYFTEELLAAQVSLNAAAGQNLDINTENAKTFQDLTMYAGYSAEAVAALYKISLQTGGSFQTIHDDIVDIANNLNESTGFSATQAQIFEQLQNASGSVRFNIKGGVEGLTKAAHTAARLGLSMDEIAAAASTHLDFENSIAKEIEAEMFLQKDLNLDKLRYAALTGDTVTAAAEEERLIRENAASLKGNMLAQQAFADATGISADRLADVLVRQEELAGMSGEQLKNELDKQEALAEQGKLAVAFDRELQSAVKVLKAELEPVAKKIVPAILKMVEQLGPMIKQAMKIVKEIGKFFMTPLGKVLLGVGGIAMGVKGVMKMTGASKFLERGSFLNPMITRPIGGMGGGGAGGGGYYGGGGGGGARYDKKTGRYRDSKGRFTKAPKGGRRRRFRGRGRGLGGLALGLGSMLGMNMMMGGSGEEAAAMTMMDAGAMGVETAADAVTGGSKSKGASPKPSKPPKAPKAKGNFFTKGLGKVGNFFKGGLDMAKSGISKIGDIGGAIKDWFAKKIKGIFPKLLKSVKKPLRGILGKVPFIGGILELLFTGMDVNQIANSKDMSKEEMYSEAGRSIISGGLGLTMGSLAAAAVSSLQAVGIPGWLLSGAAYMGGDFLGRMIGDAISDHVGGPAIGKAVLGLFESDAPKSGKATELATGGIVTSATNAIVGEAGPEAVIPLREFYAKFDELIAAVNKGGHVYLDGNKVGHSLALQTSEMG
jgi:hypothetical protein